MELMLHEAAANGDDKKIEELQIYLKRGKMLINQADVEWGNRTPLHCAAERGVRGINFVWATQPETPQSWCPKLWILPAWCKFVSSMLASSSLMKSVKINVDISRPASNCWNNSYQACGKNVLTINLHQLKPVNNLKQTCYYRAMTTNAYASWYRPDNSKKSAADSLQPRCNHRQSRRHRRS